MLAMAVRNTGKLIREKVKTDNIRLGRFFTKKETASLMAQMFSFSQKEQVWVLDPGAGTGILSAAILETICNAGAAKEIQLICYENDVVMLPMLYNNLTRLRKKCRHDYGVKLVYTVKEENFILATQDAYKPSLLSADHPKFDYIIANPPSDVLDKNAPEAYALPDLCVGPTDIAFLFAAMSSVLLADGGQMICRLPISLADSVHLTRVRRQLLSDCYVERLHLFTAPSKKNAQDTVLKNNLLIKYVKAPLAADATVSISVSAENKTDPETLPPFAYTDIVTQETGELLLLKSAEDADVLQTVRRMPQTMRSLGLKMRTGLTLPSRYPDALRTSQTDGALPLITPRQIDTGSIRMPVVQYIVPVIPSLAQKNKNMLLIKRVPAKSDKRYLLCAIYLASQLPRDRFISTANKLNYVDFEDDREMDSQLLHGLYAVLTSDLYDRYCTIVNRSAQINAGAYTDLPLPDFTTLRQIGTQLLMARQMTPRVCTAVVNNALRPKMRL